MKAVAGFAAAVLAGGHSRRMGTDKAQLRLTNGTTLLERQLRLLAGLEPEALLVSARRGQALPLLPPELRVRRVEDDGTAGPLGGIVACLRATQQPRLLVIAVDLPALRATTLAALLAASAPGAVFCQGDRLEPLVAVYPRAWLAEGAQALASGSLRLQEILRTPSATRLFPRVSVPAAEEFVNINSPEQLLQFRGGAGGAPSPSESAR